MRVAVIDIGSNSIRLLVAEPAGEGSLRELARESQVTRLGEGVERCGGLSPAAVARTTDAIADYATKLAAHRPERVLATATSAVRDAANGAQFLESVEERFGIEARLLEGETEAQLSFRGASAGRGDEQPALVVDIGGGSTELIVGTGDVVAFHDSLRLGVVRHGERHIASDPPSADELAALGEDARGEIEASLRRPERRPRADRGIAVAGTATSLAAIDLGLEPYDPDRVEGHRLGRSRIEQMLAELVSIPEAERREVAGLHVDRAPTIVPGVVILLRVMDAFGLGEIEVSEHDLLWGAALELAEHL